MNNTTEKRIDVYEILVATYDRWVSEGTTTNKEAARATVRTIRAGGRSVMVQKNGKRVNWRI